MDFECTSRDLFHEKHPFRSWSLCHRHNVEKNKRLIAQSVTKKHHFPKTTAVSIASTSIPHKTFSAQTKGFLCKVWLSIRHHQELSSGEWISLLILKRGICDSSSPLGQRFHLAGVNIEAGHPEFLLTVRQAWR
jgi:hypothetical protein